MSVRAAWQPTSSTSSIPVRSRATTPGSQHAGRNGKDLDRLLKDLDSTCQLGLKFRDSTWSPARSDKSSLSEQVQGKIKRLYFSSAPALHRVLDEFKGQLADHPRSASGDRLQSLLVLLDKETGSPFPGRPASGASHAPRDNPHKTLRSPLSSQLLSEFQLQQRDIEPESIYTTAHQTRPGTPTESDTNSEYETPPSPTTDSHAAQRRIRASAQANMGSGSKRPSDSSDNAGMSPPKFSRTAKGKQAFGDHQDDSRPMPKLQLDNSSPDLGRTFRTDTTGNTSFSSIWSEKPHLDTTGDSFLTEYTDGDIVYPKLAPVSSSGFGSIDEDELLETSRRFEEVRHQTGTDSSVPPDRRSGPPSAPIEASPGNPSASKTASASGKMSWALRDLPDRGLFINNPPEGMKGAPFIVNMQCALIATSNNVQIDSVMSRYTEAVSTYRGFWEAILNNEHAKSWNLKLRNTENAWQSHSDRYIGYTFKAQLGFNSRSKGYLFSLKLEPLQRDNSCRLQRKFGSDRFLYLTVPAFERESIPPRFKSEVHKIEEQWDKWLSRDHSFLGRKWRAFHLEDIKKKKSHRSAAERREEGAKKRVVLFAVEGWDIEPIPIGDMLNWFFPFADNMEQSFCKAFARLDLGLSRTTPTITVKPSQVLYVRDTLSDGTPEDVRFNDRRLDWSEPYDEHVVMNDGCSVISVGAAKEIWKHLGRAGPIPSVFQARIGGAKGLWMISAPTNTTDPEHNKVWIKITASQLKFTAHAEDRDVSDKGDYDPLRLTFEVNGHSSRPRASELHISFIPILIDRGVETHTIAALMQERLRYDADELLDTLLDPKKVRAWVSKQMTAKEEAFRAATTDPGVGWLGSLPNSLGEKIILLLESGFQLPNSEALANWFCRFVEAQFTSMEKSLSVPLGKATYLLGIADPHGILEPGEVHCNFMENFVDEFSNETFFCLDDMDLLIARQPACRRSDIQKVRATFKMELAYLPDVVIFPSKGQFPLAGKLQGGDYDGDRFWLCWEQSLVEPFKNAPAPLHSPKPADYGIKVEKRKVREIINVHNLNTVGFWLEESFKFRNNPGLLGIVTNFLESQAYLQNTIHSPSLEALCAVHDLLVDTAKQGFVFTRKDFDNFVKGCRDLKPKARKPAYKEVMDRSGRDMAQRTKREPKPNLRNPLDFLFFSILRPQNLTTMNLLRERLKSATSTVDSDFQQLYLEELEECKDDDPEVFQELKRLKGKLDGVHRCWAAELKKSPDFTSTAFNQAVEKSFEKYRAIQPSNTGNKLIKRWMRHRIACFTEWDLIKASALAHFKPDKDIFVFHMAGAEYCYMKSGRDSYVRTLPWSMYTGLKPRKIKRIPNLDGAADDEDGYDTAEEFV